MRRGVLLVILLWISLGSRALFADDAIPQVDDSLSPSNRWSTWMKGFDLGGRALGHFGSSNSINAPDGGIGIQGSGHIWYEHLIEFHANLGLGVTAGYFSFGAGTKINLIEFVKDPTNMVIVRGIQRGLATSLFQNFMFYGMLEYQHYSFPTYADPTLGQNYDLSTFALHYGLGAQWYFYAKNKFARRFYIDLSGSFTRIDGVNFILPYLGVGFEYK